MQIELLPYGIYFKPGDVSQEQIDAVKQECQELIDQIKSAKKGE